MAFAFSIPINFRLKRNKADELSPVFFTQTKIRNNEMGFGTKIAYFFKWYIFGVLLAIIRLPFVFLLLGLIFLLDSLLRFVRSS
jgi:hypothetical protein